MRHSVEREREITVLAFLMLYYKFLTYLYFSLLVVFLSISSNFAGDRYLQKHYWFAYGSPFHFHSELSNGEDHGPFFLENLFMPLYNNNDPLAYAKIREIQKDSTLPYKKF